MFAISAWVKGMAGCEWLGVTMGLSARSGVGRSGPGGCKRVADNFTRFQRCGAEQNDADTNNCQQTGLEETGNSSSSIFIIQF